MITGPQIKAARMLLGLSQKELAERALLSVPTIQRMEARPGTVGGAAESLTRVHEALERAGVRLLGNGETSTEGGRGVRLVRDERLDPATADQPPDKRP